MTNQEPKTIRLFCKKGYAVHKTSMEKCLKCAYFGKPCITTTPPSSEVIERLRCDEDDRE